MAPAARRECAANAARCTAGGNDIVNGTSDKGSDDDEANASAARREYVASIASNDDKAVATAKRRACATRVARPPDGRLRCPSGREATDATARHMRTTTAAQRTGVNKAASDAKGDDVSFCDDYSNIDAGDDTEDNAERPGQPHDHATDDDDNYDVEEAGGHKSAVGRRVAKKRPYSPKDFSTNDGANKEARATGGEEGGPKAANAAAAGGSAARGTATQRRKGYPKLSDHEATPEADQVEDSGEEAYSKADRGRGKGRTNPMMIRASAEALPKISSPSAAATNPMKNRADAEALPKFSSAASAGSSEEGKPLDNAGMAELKRPMVVHGTMAAQFA